MRRYVLFGSAAAAALVIAVAAIIGLRGTPAPPAQVAPHDLAAVPAPAAKPPAAPVLPSFDIVTVDPHGQAVIAGRAMPHDRVRVLDGDKLLGEVTADARGEFVLVPSTPIPFGDRKLSLEATESGGGKSRRSADVVALSVIRPTSPDAQSSALAVLVPGDSSQPARVLQEPDWAAKVGKLLSLDTASYGADHRLVLSGHAVPGARLRVYAGKVLLGNVTADPTGRWSLASADPMPDGGFQLQLEQLGADGMVASRITAPFEPLAGTALAKSGTYVVRQGNSLWVIARELYGQGDRYTVIFSANRGQIQDPNLIYPGQQFKVPKS